MSHSFCKKFALISLHNLPYNWTWVQTNQKNNLFKICVICSSLRNKMIIPIWIKYNQTAVLCKLKLQLVLITIISFAFINQVDDPIALLKINHLKFNRKRLGFDMAMAPHRFVTGSDEQITWIKIHNSVKIFQHSLRCDKMWWKLT